MDSRALSIEPSRTVYRWDLDKTYLRTEFDTFGDLVRTAFEAPWSKRTVPGAAHLLREIAQTKPHGVHILSGSPEQMRRVLEAKLAQDGVRWNSFVLKPSLRNLMRGRLRFVKDQLGYKLGVLLSSRLTLTDAPDEVLFGDDAEADAFIYSLYADICRGEVSENVLASVLDLARLYPDDREALLARARAVPRGECVRQIFIHLDRVSSPEMFRVFGPRVCPIHNYFQAALVLLERGAIDADAALRVGRDIVDGQGFNPDALTASFMDLHARGMVGTRAVLALADAVLTEGRPSTMALADRVLRSFVERVAESRGGLQDVGRTSTAAIDYEELFLRDKARAHEAKVRALWGRR